MAALFSAFSIAASPVISNVEALKMSKQAQKQTWNQEYAMGKVRGRF